MLHNYLGDSTAIEHKMKMAKNEFMIWKIHIYDDTQQSIDLS